MDKKDVVIYHGIRDGKYDVTIDGERRLLEPLPFPVQLKMTKAPLPLSGVNLIFAERERQKFDEGWTAEHDAEHTYGELADAAASYAMTPDTRATITAVCMERDGLPPMWPWDKQWWKPTPDNRIRELVKAGALIAAEIDRLLVAMAPEIAQSIMEDAEKLIRTLSENAWRRLPAEKSLFATPKDTNDGKEEEVSL